MDVNVVFIRNICPGEQHLDLLSRPVGLRPNNGKRKCLASEDRAVVHASSIGILVTTGTDGRAVPARRLSAAGIDASGGRSWSCVRRSQTNIEHWFFPNGSSDVALGVRCVRATNRHDAQQANAT